MAFDNNKLGELRPNQIITTFGPGSVVDAVKDSVTILDISYWKQKGQKIIDGRLASYLGVDCFFMPRTSFSGDVPVVTFPYWHVCSNLKCGRLFDARKNFDLDKYLKYGVTCPECHRPAYPSRFITICEDGHMSDFPWKWWVHRGNLDCNGTLKMYSTGNTSTLADMWVECSCGAKRSMNGATQRENFEDISSYFSELVDTIIQKSQRGVFVKFFVNDIDKQPSFDKILRYKGRFLKIYNYRQDDDKMAALHAKVISVDQQQTLITSANLSYHGQQGNIELGTLIESKQIAKQIDDIFTKLIFTKDFCEI